MGPPFNSHMPMLLSTTWSTSMVHAITVGSEVSVFLSVMSGVCVLALMGAIFVSYRASGSCVGGLPTGLYPLSQRCIGYFIDHALKDKCMKRKYRIPIQSPQ